MISRLLPIALAATLLVGAAPSFAVPEPAPAAVRAATIRLREASAEKPPRDQVKLSALLSIDDLSASFDPGVETVEVWIGDELCVSAHPGDGARWSRVRGRPWCWRGRMKETPGCAGKGRIKLDLRNGKLTLDARRIDARPATLAGATNVPIRVLVGDQEFFDLVSFTTSPQRWKFRDPNARPPREIQDYPGGRDPGPGTDPGGANDGPVGHIELRSGSRYREDPMPGFRVVARTEADWASLWDRDWRTVYGGSAPWVDFPSRMVVTFTGSVGDGFESVWFERKGDDLIGHVVIDPLDVNGGYVPSYRVFGAFAVPQVPGKVTFEMRFDGDTKIYTMECSDWNPAW